MTTKVKDLMKEPFYALIMFKIESVIGEWDRKAVDQGNDISDAMVRSVLNKAISLMKGKKPGILPSRPKKREFLQQNLLQIINELKKETVGSILEDFNQMVTSRDWLLSLRAISDSLKLRTYNEPGCRAYLDFLISFQSEIAH